MGWLQSECPSCQSRVWLETELDDTNSWYQLIITIRISKKQQIIHLGQIYAVESMSK